MTRNAFWGLCIGLCLAGTQAIAQKMESKSIKTTDKTDSISSISMESPKEKLYLLLSEDLKPPLSTQECQVQKGFKEDLKEALS